MSKAALVIANIRVTDGQAVDAYRVPSSEAVAAYVGVS